MIATFDYLNHKGRLATRKVDVDSLEFHSNPGFGYQGGWFISGFDTEKSARRSFALTHIILPESYFIRVAPGIGNIVHRLLRISTETD